MFTTAQIRKILEDLVVAGISGAMIGVAAVDLPWPWIIPPIVALLSKLRDLARHISPE